MGKEGVCKALFFYSRPSDIDKGNWWSEMVVVVERAFEDRAGGSLESFPARG